MDFWCLFLLQKSGIQAKGANTKEKRMSKSDLDVLHQTSRTGADLPGGLSCLTIPSPNMRKLACAVVSSSMQVARDRNYISCNIAMKITAEVNRLKRAEEQQLMDTYSARKRTVKVYSAAQLNCLQNICWQEEPSLYLPMLLATATGFRISELRALKYENIDFLNKYASTETQLGRTKISFCLFFLNKYYDIMEEGREQL